MRVAVATNTTSVPFVPNNKRFSLGALMRDVPTQSFPGYLDDVGLWNTALTKEHIAIIHALGRYSRVDLDDAAIATLVDAGLTAGSSAIAGGYRWLATTGLSGAVGSTGLLDGQPYLVLNASGGGLVGISTQPPANHWFDANSTAADFGVANNGTYDWKGGNLWNPSNTGGSPVGPWVSGNDANFVGAGLGTRYTVRLGATGTNHVMLRNLWLNSDGAEPGTPHGSGDVVIGASGDTGELRLTADSSIGTAGGILTVNNPCNLGDGQSLNCGGGTVRLYGFVAGTGTAGVTLSAGGFFSGELAAGTLTLANPGNTYPGATAVAAGYTLEVAKLANGGSPSSSGASSNAATNLILGGGTLRYIGATAAIDRSFILAPDTVSMIDVSAVDAVLTFSGSSTATSGGLIKQGAGTLALAGINMYTGDTIVNGGTLAVTGASIADPNTLVISGGNVNATGTETVESLFFGDVQQAADTWGHQARVPPILTTSVSPAPGGSASRRVRSGAGSAASVEYGSDLAVWGSYSVGAAPGAAPVVIQEDAPDATLDSVTVTIPTGGAPKFFARLKVSN